MCFSFRNTLALLALKRSLSLDGIHQANTSSFRTSKLEQQVKSNKGAGDDTFFNLSLVVVNFVVSCLVEETPCEIMCLFILFFSTRVMLHNDCDQNCTQSKKALALEQGPIPFLRDV